MADIKDTERDSSLQTESSLKPLVRPVQTLAPDDTCLEAARLMRSENIGSVVVARAGEPVGLVTDRDWAMRVLADAQDPAVVRLKDIMSVDPIYISERRNLDEQWRPCAITGCVAAFPYQ